MSVGRNQVQTVLKLRLADMQLRENIHVDVGSHIIFQLENFHFAVKYKYFNCKYL